MIKPRMFSSDPTIPKENINIEAYESATAVGLKVDAPTDNGHGNDSDSELDEHKKVAAMAFYKCNQRRKDNKLSKNKQARQPRKEASTKR